MVCTNRVNCETKIEALLLIDFSLIEMLNACNFYCNVKFTVMLQKNILYVENIPYIEKYSLY